MLSYYKICKCDSGFVDIKCSRYVCRKDNETSGNESGALVGQNMSQVLAALLQKEEILNTVKGS